MSRDFKEPSGPARSKRTWQTPRLSVLAVCALAANLGCAVGSLAAIVLGHMALAAMKQEPTLKGYRMAIAGLLTGYIMTLIYLTIIVIYVMYMPEFIQAAEDAKLRQQVSTPTLDTNIFLHSTPPAPVPPPQVAVTPQAPVMAPSVPAILPATTNSPAQSTNSAPPATNSPDSSNPNSAPSTNVPPINP